MVCSKSPSHVACACADVANADAERRAARRTGLRLRFISISKPVSLIIVARAVRVRFDFAVVPSAEFLGRLVPHVDSMVRDVRVFRVRDVLGGQPLAKARSNPTSVDMFEVAVASRVSVRSGGKSECEDREANSS